MKDKFDFGIPSPLKNDVMMIVMMMVVVVVMMMLMMILVLMLARPKTPRGEEKEITEVPASTSVVPASTSMVPDVQQWYHGASSFPGLPQWWRRR